ncbi:MAG: cohesin domain-containing protein [Candidatus Scatovivens sp.]
MKKTFVIFIILLWCMTITCMASGVSMSLNTDKSKVQSKENFTIKISVNNFVRPGEQKAVEAKLEYNKNIFEFQNINWCSNWIGSISSDKTGIVASKSGNVTQTETIAEITFKVKESAQVGNSAIKIKNVLTSSNGDEVTAPENQIYLEVYKQAPEESKPEIENPETENSELDQQENNTVINSEEPEDQSQSQVTTPNVTTKNTKQTKKNKATTESKTQPEDIKLNNEENSEQIEENAKVNDTTELNNIDKNESSNILDKTNEIKKEETNPSEKINKVYITSIIILVAIGLVLILFIKLKKLI